MTKEFHKGLPTMMSIIVISLLVGCTVLQAQTLVSSQDVSKRNEMTVHRFYEECLNRRHMSILPELVSPGVINHFNDKDEIGIEAFTRAVQRITGIFPDGRFVIEDIVASGNNVAAHWSMTAINSAPIAGNPATGRTVTERAVVFYRFEGEKIAEVWLQVDQIGLFRQLGIKELAIDGQISAQTPH